MSLYFFVNYLVREYMNRAKNQQSYPWETNNLKKKVDVITRFPEWHAYRNDMHITSIEETNGIRNGMSKITSDNQLSKELSRLILLDANETGISDNKRYLYCELLFINGEINNMVNNKICLKPKNLRYLFIVYYHYVLDNPLVLLIRDLMRDQEFFMRRIKRIFDYPCFREWVTIRNQLKEYKTYSIFESHHTKWNKTELFNIFKCELYQSGQIKQFNNKLKTYEIIDSNRKRSLSSVIGDTWEILFP